MGIEGPILNCGSCLRTGQPSARPGGGQRCRYRDIVDARGGGLPGVCESARRLALELRPAWRRATAKKDLRVFSRCVPYCRIRSALVVLYFSAVSCSRWVCRNPHSICGLFWTLPPPALTCTVLGCFHQTYTNCKVPWELCAIVQRLPT